MLDSLGSQMSRQPVDDGHERMNGSLLPVSTAKEASVRTMGLGGMSGRQETLSSVTLS